MSLAGRVWGVLAFGVVAAGIGATTLRANAERPAIGFPARLSETGLYGADGSIDPRNRPFAPQYPLWTDGAAKRRWVRLPDGSQIDARDVDGWRFPPGTTFWKEFAWQGRKVETRMIRIGEDGGPEFASYAWNDAGTEAVLAPPAGIARAHEVTRGRWHAIPSVTDCQSCHESGPSYILGFSALQLSDDRDPLAPHAEPLPTGAVTLGSLAREDRLRPPLGAFITHAPRIKARDAVERAALGYLSTNCGTCHNLSGPLARLQFSLRHDLSVAPGGHEPALSTAVGNAGRFLVPGDTAGSRLVEPGHPEASAIVHRMRSRRPSTQMPPLGTVVADSVGIEIVRRWIRGLAGASGEEGRGR